jgi:hypothetical protein
MFNVSIIKSFQVLNCYLKQEERSLSQRELVTQEYESAKNITILGYKS